MFSLIVRRFPKERSTNKKSMIDGWLKARLVAITPPRDLPKTPIFPLSPRSLMRNLNTDSLS